MLGFLQSSGLVHVGDRVQPVWHYGVWKGSQEHCIGNAWLVVFPLLVLNTRSVVAPGSPTADMEFQLASI